VDIRMNGDGSRTVRMSAEEWEGIRAAVQIAFCDEVPEEFREVADLLWNAIQDDPTQCECGRGPLLVGNGTPDCCAKCAQEAEAEEREDAEALRATEDPAGGDDGYDSDRE